MYHRRTSGYIPLKSCTPVLRILLIIHSPGDELEILHLAISTNSWYNARDGLFKVLSQIRIVPQRPRREVDELRTIDIGRSSCTASRAGGFGGRRAVHGVEVVETRVILNVLLEIFIKCRGEIGCETACWSLLCHDTLKSWKSFRRSVVDRCARS